MAGLDGVVWISLDPVRKAVDFYPQQIARRIENSLTVGEERCVLGSDFFNATIHFNHSTGECYQTTPGQNMGRGGFKQPGYRTVRRLTKSADDLTTTLYARRINGEWRLTNESAAAEWTFVETFPAECVIQPAGQRGAERPRAWLGADLEASIEERRSRAIVVWQWCLGTPETHGDLMRLDERCWCPYLQQDNASIEAAFERNETAATIALQSRTLRIRFNYGSTFALQLDESRAKERMVRRMVKTAQDLVEMHSRMASSEAVNSQWAEGEVAPPEFVCPITQTVFRDPVCTADGHTYDREAILTWFLGHNTSPLTGLPLPSKHLVPNTALREQILAYLSAHGASSDLAMD